MARKRWSAENSEGYAAPVGLTVDVVVLTVLSGSLSVLLVKRSGGSLALPGGFVGARESPATTALRKLEEKTGVGDVYIEQLGAYAEPGRDPRGWIPTIAYLALVPPSTSPSDPDARWAEVGSLPALAFDHAEIVAAALDRVRGKLWWSNVAVGILPGAFVLSEAREVYQAISGARYDPATFARDLQATGLIEPTGKQRRPERGRPAAEFRFKSADLEWGAGRRKRVAPGA
jgi:8-oxo-dGTP diphosphatase